jgi:lipopolysaccharide/colanic/teichoic acid biosynthesis glycosyltransferase
MSCERPVLLAIDGVARRLVCEEARAGLFAEPENPKAIADGIRRLAADHAMREELGRNGRRWVLENADRETLAKRYLDVMSDVERRVGGHRVYRTFVKPFADRLLAALGLMLLSPAIAATGLAVRVLLGRPVIFRQERIGKHDAPFTFLKFRTMTDRRDAAGRLLPDAERLTGFGQFLRSTSLDELPQLWNVLRGDMSLVGPRPLLPEYLPRYSPFQRRRHDVKPGITGSAQVQGRNELSWERKFELDVWYAERCSPRVDLRILFQTFAAVARREGISRKGHATAPPFLGT